MSFRSILVVRVKPGMGAEAAAAFLERGVLSECARVIPQFLGGELCRSATDPDQFCVFAEWSDVQGWHDWKAHPVGDAVTVDLAHYIASVECGDVFNTAGA